MREDRRCRLPSQVVDCVAGVGQPTQRRRLLFDEAAHERAVFVERRALTRRVLLEGERQLGAALGRECRETERAQGLIEVRCPMRHGASYEARSRSPTRVVLCRSSFLPSDDTAKAGSSSSRSSSSESSSAHCSGPAGRGRAVAPDRRPRARRDLRGRGRRQQSLARTVVHAAAAAPRGLDAPTRHGDLSCAIPQRVRRAHRRRRGLSIGRLVLREARVVLGQ